MRQVSRKSLFIAKKIKKGTIITEDMLTLKRPGTGLYEAELESIVGSVSNSDLLPGDMINFGDFRVD
jgi:sialic acid synthase SpsE